MTTILIWTFIVLCFAAAIYFCRDKYIPTDPEQDEHEGGV